MLHNSENAVVGILVESLSNDDGDQNGKRAKRPKLAKQQLCTCITLSLHISLLSLQVHDVTMPNFTFCGEYEHKTTALFFFP